MLTLAARQEPHQIGNFLGLLAAILLAWAGYSIHQRWMRLQDEEPLSPASEPAALQGVKPQATAGTDTNLTPSPTTETAVDELERFVEQSVGNKARTKEIVLAAKSRFGVSRSTVMRAMKRAKGSDS